MSSVKRMACIVAMIAVAFMAVPMGAQLTMESMKLIATPKPEADRGVIVVDPGHGGRDGGAESESGAIEKDINLAIALELKKIAEQNGFEVVMTRDTDIALGLTESIAPRSKKTADLIARKKIIDATEPLLTVSIHLNSFTEDRSVHGAQVFYPSGEDKVASNSDAAAQSASNTGTTLSAATAADKQSESSKAAAQDSTTATPIADSKKLAELIQAELISGLNDGTERTVMSKSNMRLFKNVSTPIVLVECGFLSNYEESKKLETAEYQGEIALFIYNGIAKYTNCK